MFTRTVSLVLIAAIIACPLWCGSGLCHAGQCCSVKQSSQQSFPGHGAVNCCCTRSSPDGDDQAPSRCPAKSSCQGVCGGAIFEKLGELDSVEDSFFLPLADAEVSVSSWLLQCRSPDVAHHHCQSGGNYGRSLRTLYMSLVC